MGAAFCFVFYFASVFNEGLPCVLYFKSVAGVWFAFKNLVGALDFFFFVLNPQSAAVAPTTENQTRRRCCALKCYSPPPEPHASP